MKNTLVVLGTIIVVGFFTNTATAQTVKTATATAGAKLIKPMTIGKTNEMYFGTINVLTGVAGTVKLSPEGVTTFAGVEDGVVGGKATGAAYTVTGTKNSTYALTLPSNGAVTVTEGGSAGGVMSINNFTAKFENAAAAGTASKLNETGQDTFKVGATLVVNADQATGVYSGSFDVSVDYN